MGQDRRAPVGWMSGVGQAGTQPLGNEGTGVDSGRSVVRRDGTFSTIPVVPLPRPVEHKLARMQVTLVYLFP
jgi:hypothetical protein